jgi:hypothetical protein
MYKFHIVIRDKFATVPKKHRLSTEVAYDWLTKNDIDVASAHLDLSPKEVEDLRKLCHNNLGLKGYKITAIAFYNGVSNDGYDIKYQEETIYEAYNNSKPINTSYQRIKNADPHIAAQNMELSTNQTVALKKICNGASVIQREKAIEFYNGVKNSGYDVKYQKEFLECHRYYGESSDETYQRVKNADPQIAAQYLGLSDEQAALLIKICYRKSVEYKEIVIEFFEGVKNNFYDVKYLKEILECVKETLECWGYYSKSLDETYQSVKNSDPQIVIQCLELSDGQAAELVKICKGRSVGEVVIDFFKGVKKDIYDVKYLKETLEWVRWNSEKSLDESYQRVRNADPQIAAQYLGLSDEQAAALVKMCKGKKVEHREVAIAFYEGVKNSGYEKKYAEDFINIVKWSSTPADEAYQRVKNADPKLAAQRIELSTDHTVELKKICNGASVIHKERAIEFYEGIRNGSYDVQYAHETIREADKKCISVDDSYKHVKNADPKLAAQRLGLSEDQAAVLKKICKGKVLSSREKTIELYRDFMSLGYDIQYAQETIDEVKKNGKPMNKVYQHVKKLHNKITQLKATVCL